MEQALRVVEVVLLGLILVSLWAVLYQLVKQQGRLLLRQDAMEHRFAHSGWGAHTNGLVALDVPAQPSGLAVGTPISPFRLPDLKGQMVALEEFRGKRVLLIHWSPQCGFCDLIAPDLARLQADLQKRNVQVVLVSYEDDASNRTLAQEHGLAFPILLQKDGTQPLEVFQNQGTPTAYLLDEQGRVAEPLAVGADQVVALAGAAATAGSKKKRLPSERSLNESRLERHGLKAGTPAPPFRLPDVYGRMVSLEEYRGQRVLLIFTDPDCAPCDQLAPHLVRLHQQLRDKSLALVMVGRGDLEGNRRKAQEHGFEFPVVLQPGWRLSKEYGIFATPVAFLVNEDSVIAQGAAKGVDEILALATEDLAPEKEAGHGRTV